MKRDEIKVGIKVTDPLFEGIGTITDVKKTVFTVVFASRSGEQKYDYQHAQFLSPYTPPVIRRPKK